MSDEDLTFKKKHETVIRYDPPKHRCQKHGETDAVMTISLYHEGNNGFVPDESATYCMVCYRDFLDQHIGRMEEAP